MIETQMASARSTLQHLLHECKNMRELKQIHAQIIKSPLLPKDDQNFLITRLLFFSVISDSCSHGYAIDVFRAIENPNLYVYNVMIRAYACRKIGGRDEALSFGSLLLYKQMLCDGISPNGLTFPFLVKECTSRVDGGAGRSIHGQAVKYGLDSDVFVQNSLMSMYSACGFLSSARKLFDETPGRDVVSWNSMIKGYLKSGSLDEALKLFRKMKKRSIFTWNSVITGFVQGGRPKEALELFHEMQITGAGGDIVRPDKITVASVLAACAHLGAIDHGIWVHGYLRRSGLESDVVIGTALVDMYGKCGCVDKAYEVFQEMPMKDTLAWTAMISVMALHGFGNEAFGLFKQMETARVKPNGVTFVALLSACAHSGFVEKGRWCFDAMKHAYLIEPQLYHYACMVDILSRAGLIEEAEQCIRSMPMKPDTFVWGALLGGCQIHGKVELGARVAHYLIDLEPLNHAFYVNLCDIYAKACRFNDVKRIKSLMKERGIKKEVPGCSMIEINGFVLEFSVRGSPNVEMEGLLWILNQLNNDISRDKDTCFRESM